MRSAGDDILSVAVADAEAAQHLAAELRASGQWLEAVAGLDSVVVRFDIARLGHRDAADRLDAAMRRLPPLPERLVRTIQIPVVYGGESGPDFEFVCDTLGLTGKALIELHTGEYRVDMLGFTPGFAYIGGLDARLFIDRLEHPRQRVPAGSVGIAGGRSGLYSLAGPGGWPLIGRTGKRLFDASREDPFVLSPGAKVVFTAVDAS